MGSTDSIPENNSLKLNRDNWQEQEALDWEWDKEGDYKRLKNNMTGEELDEYVVHLGSRESMREYMEMCHFRNEQNHLVSVRNINQENVKELCFNAFNLMVYIEHMYLRLSDIKDIQFPENIYVLKRALQGLKVLYEKVGHFFVSENLICINEEGIVKVWLNPNLSNIEPQTTGKYAFYPFKQKFDEEQEDIMVWTTISMIESASNNHTIPNGFNFSSFLERENQRNLNFKEALENLDSYIAETMIRVPHHFETAVKVIRERKGIFDSEIDININKPKTVDLQAAIMRGKFKESEVERVHGFHNQTMRSYISESNNTFADKLRNFDFGKGNSINLQSNISGLKESPDKESGIESAIFNLHQPRTEKIISNQISQVSELPGTQSHAIFSSFHHVLARVSNQNSQIISNERSNSGANNPNQMTYFSQYLDSGTKNKNHGENDMRRQIQGTTSLMTSRIGTAKLSSLQKPTITFSYSGQFSMRPSLNHSGQVSAHTSPQQSRINSEESLNEIPNSNFLPMSPPTIDINQKNFFDNNNSENSNFSNPVLEFSKKSDTNKKYFTRIDSFKAPTEKNSQIDSIIENNNGYQKLEQRKPSERMENLERQQINKKQLNQNFETQKVEYAHHNPMFQAHGEKLRSHIPQISLEEMKKFLEESRLNMDPEIMNDLMRYEQKRRRV